VTGKLGGIAGGFGKDERRDERMKIDWELVAEAFRVQCAFEHVSLAEAGRRLGFSRSTASRIACGKPVDADTLLAVAIWTKVPLAAIAAHKEVSE
jgi:transcriptional regulator with XRE-family HTH domain